jgi:2-haloacid dehalogenase/putative hydrolase of the HAD superfamily
VTSLRWPVPSGGYDIVTFDCYGTLIDWESGIASAFIAEAARAGVTLQRDAIIDAYMQVEPEVEAAAFMTYREVLTQTAREVAHRLGWSLEPSRAHFLPDSLPSWQPFADTVPALRRIATKYRLGILSNVDDDLIAATQRHFPGVHFDLIVTAQQVNAYKPAYAHFEVARRRLGVARWLHAAQSYFHDVVPAASLRVPVVWVNRKGETSNADGPQPTTEVRDLAALADYLGV